MQVYGNVFENYSVIIPMGIGAVTLLPIIQMGTSVGIELHIN